LIRRRSTLSRENSTDRQIDRELCSSLVKLTIIGGYHTACTDSKYMATRKRPREVELEVASTHKVHLTPLYFDSKNVSSSSSYITLSLPVSLGRRNLAEWWWEYCPNACDAAKKESVPCPKYCFPVRRKSHREALSQRMVDIDATGKVLIVGRHPKLIHWTGNLDAGECCRFGIGKTGETLWMLFTLQLVRAVTPPQHTWLQASERKRRLGIFERAFPLNDDSPGKRQLFSGLSSTPEDTSQEHSVQTKRRKGQKASSQEAIVVRHDLKEVEPTSRDERSSLVPREDEMHSSVVVDLQALVPIDPPEDTSQEHYVQTKRREGQKASSQEAIVVRHDLKEVAPTSRAKRSSLVPREDEMHSSVVDLQALVPTDPHVASGAVLESGLATEKFVPIAASRNVTPHTTSARDVEARTTTASFPLYADFEISPTLFQSTEEPDDSQPAPTVRRRLRFDTNCASGRNVAAENQLVRSPSPSLSMPMGLSMEDSQQSIHEATEPQWRILGDSQTSPRVRSCLDMKLSDWEQVKCNATSGSVSRAIADLVVGKNKGGDGPTWYPSLGRLKLHWFLSGIIEQQFAEWFSVGAASGDQGLRKSTASTAFEGHRE
jgi:hypothetical protein